MSNCFLVYLVLFLYILPIVLVVSNRTLKDKYDIPSKTTFWAAGISAAVGFLIAFFYLPFLFGRRGLDLLKVSTTLTNCWKTGKV